MATLTRITGMLMLSIALPASAVVAEYVEQAPAGAADNVIELGLAVPEPVTSSVPVAGFRSYASLMAGLDLLALEHAYVRRHRLGQSLNGEAIYAWQFGDNTNAPVMLQSGGIHAREWASPEAVGGILENLVAAAEDGGVVSWLRDNANILLVPVLNPDGFLTTQRAPRTTRIDEDPQNSPSDPLYPRDGRMRRKNLSNSDGQLESADDTLQGVDLNRNLGPYWNSGRGSSRTPSSIVYNGASVESEPETQALLAAGALLGTDTLRLYIDTHSFGRVFFYNNTGNSRLFQISQDLVNLIRQVPALAYAEDAVAPGLGIGASDEYFSYTLNVPAYTLELEPGTSQLADYGGKPGVSHSGFILPESEITRVREEVYQMALLAYYHQMGPAIVREVRLTQTDGEMIYRQSWQDQNSTTRTLQTAPNTALQAGQRYTLHLIFNKPMRWIDAQGQAVNYPAQNLSLHPNLSLFSSRSEELPAGQWSKTRYAADTYSVDFTLPADMSSPVNLHIAVRDMAGRALDSDPASVTRWQDGHWVGFENENGQSGDVGGEDHNTLLQIAGAPSATPAPASTGGSGAPSLFFLITLSALARRARHGIA